jgi:hypothetical protein
MVIVKRDVNGRDAFKRKDGKWLPSAAFKEFLNPLKECLG